MALVGGGLSTPCSETGGPSLPGSTVIPVKGSALEHAGRPAHVPGEEAWATLLPAGWDWGEPAPPEAAQEDLAGPVLRLSIKVCLIRCSKWCGQFLNGGIYITDSMDRKLSKLGEMVEGRGAWSAAAQGLSKSRTRLTTGQQSVSLLLSSCAFACTVQPVGSEIPQPGIEPTSPTPKCGVFTSGPPGKSQNSAESLPHTCRPVNLQGGERRASTHRLFPPCLQIEMLSPLEAVASRFREQYKIFAMALDTTRHELPVKSVHLDGDRQLFLGESWTAAGQGAGQATAACWHLLGPGSLYPSVSFSQGDGVYPVKWQRMRGGRQG